MHTPSTKQTLPLETITELKRRVDGHLLAVEKLRGVFDQQLAPYCAILAERIEQVVLPVLADGLEAATVLQEAEVTLPECTVQSLVNHVMMAMELESWKENDGDEAN